MSNPTWAIGIGLLLGAWTGMAQQQGPRRTPLGTQVPRPNLPQRGQPPRTQSGRALPKLFEYQTRGSRLRDDGMHGKDRLLTIEESNGRTTSYLIDGVTALVTRLELVSGQAPDMLGRPLSIVQSYVFSNFRAVQGVPTPFKVQHFNNGIKVDELLFTSVQYNTGIADDVFRP